MKTYKAFTLVEILIVVIILGILAAIVIPQFTEASTDARESALKTDLQTVRSQLELYKVQHLENYPGDNAGVFDAALFLSQMTSETDQDGVVAAGAVYGPYLQSFPTNPFVVSTIATLTGGAAAVPGDNASHWYFETDTGKGSPNDDDGYSSL